MMPHGYGKQDMAHVNICSVQQIIWKVFTSLGDPEAPTRCSSSPLIYNTKQQQSNKKQFEPRTKMFYLTLRGGLSQIQHTNLMLSDSQIRAHIIICVKMVTNSRQASS